MKFYATTTSERASKGQGGKYLHIEVKNEKKEIIAQMYFEENRAIISINEDIKLDQRILKGKSQKGEHCNGKCADRLCTDC